MSYECLNTYQYVLFIYFLIYYYTYINEWLLGGSGVGSFPMPTTVPQCPLRGLAPSRVALVEASGVRLRVGISLCRWRHSGGSALDGYPPGNGFPITTHCRGKRKSFVFGGIFLVPRRGYMSQTKAAWLIYIQEIIWVADASAKQCHRIVCQSCYCCVLLRLILLLQLLLLLMMLMMCVLFFYFRFVLSFKSGFHQKTRKAAWNSSDRDFHAWNSPRLVEVGISEAKNVPFLPQSWKYWKCGRYPPLWKESK